MGLSGIWASPIIQAAERTDFENGLRPGNRGEVFCD